jgi:hypothetical protein
MPKRIRGEELRRTHDTHHGTESIFLANGWSSPAAHPFWQPIQVSSDERSPKAAQIVTRCTIMNGRQSSGSVAFSGKVCSNRRRKESSARLMLLVHVGLNRVMSDPKIEGRLVELSAGERAFCARHYPQRLLIWCNALSTSFAIRLASPQT